MEEEREIPTIRPLKINYLKSTRQVVVVCPYCRKQHCHGWPYDSDEIGHRVNDCPTLGGYIIEH